jgi:hypothetical protein
MMAWQMTIHANAVFQYLMTDNESWMAYDYTPSRIWMMAQNDVDPIARPTNHPRKPKMTVFLGVKDIDFINILLEKPN